MVTLGHRGIIDLDTLGQIASLGNILLEHTVVYNTRKENKHSLGRTLPTIGPDNLPSEWAGPPIIVT